MLSTSMNISQRQWDCYSQTNKEREKNVGHEQLVNTALPSKTRKPEFEMGNIFHSYQIRIDEFPEMFHFLWCYLNDL